MHERTTPSGAPPFETSHDASWRTALWVGLLGGISALLTASHTCGAPFAAFATITATTLPRRQALGAMLIVWLANQAAGFTVLDYPRSAETVAWGVVIGFAALLAMFAAAWVRGLAYSRGPVRVLASFVTAFAIYQLMLYGLAVSLLGGTGAFAPKIVGQLLLTNAVALVGLIGLHRLVSIAARLRRRHSTPAVAADVA